MGDTSLSLGNRKLVVLGLPWEVDTGGLKQYMSKYGTLDDVVVMKERGSGRSRGFGYVTFSSSESAEKALTAQHVLNGRSLEVKIATPKEDMKQPFKKIARIFVARISAQVTQEEFRRYFEKFGTVTDIYMPKDQSSNLHRGIGFITYESSESVEKVMAETHEIGGSIVAVDRATPKEEAGKEYGKETAKQFEQGFSGAYGAYSPYIAAAAAAARFGGFGFPPFGAFDYAGPRVAGDLGPAGFGGGFGGPLLPSSGPPLSLPGATGPSGFGSGGQPNPLGRGSANKVFVGRLPSEITSDDLQQYFGNFGRILDIYLPKDPKRTGHKGFGFVTFASEGTAERVALRSHELLGHQIAVEVATPVHEAGGSKHSEGRSTAGISKAVSGSMFPGSGYRPNFNHHNWWGPYGGGGGGVGPINGGPFGGNKAFRMEPRYRPY